MKQVKLLATISVAAGMLFLSACNSGDDKKAKEAAADTTVKTETPPPVTPAPQGPTSMMTITHKVANYAKWKPAYDSHDSARLANGLHNYVIARGTDDSNMVMVAMRMDDVDKAKAMAASPELKERMKKGGVIGMPSIDYLESVMNDTTHIQETVRLMVKSKVKDWDAWKKVFDTDKQARMDAGLTDRVISHTVGDTHSITLVFAVADVAKAKAFAGSKELKDKMKEAGVEGPPTMFFYRIVQKY
jgi:hypothetical protein